MSGSFGAWDWAVVVALLLATTLMSVNDGRYVHDLASLRFGCSNRLKEGPTSAAGIVDNEHFRAGLQWPFN